MNVTKEDCSTKCDKILQTILHKVEQKFKKHFILLQVTVKEQRNLLDTMWVQSQRYLILTRGGICVRPYPLAPSNREEREIKEGFRQNMKLLRQSNNKLTKSLCSVKEICQAFDGALANVDASLPCSIIEGNRARQPIYYYIELFSDGYKFFHKIEDQLKMAERLLMVDDIGSILEYKHLLELNEKVNQYFEQCLGNK